MSETTNSSREAALWAYWQLASERTQLNHIAFPKNTEATFEVELEILKNSKLSTAICEKIFATQNSDVRRIWIATSVAALSNEDASALVPYWLPAICDQDGNLALETGLSYPFIPSVLLDPLNDAPLLGTLPQIDEAWHTLFSKSLPETWSALQEKALEMLETVAGTHWQARITEKGYQWQTKGLVFVPAIQSYPTEGVFAKFAQLDEPHCQDELTGEALTSAYDTYLGYPGESGLVASDMKAMLHLLQLPVGEMQSVAAPSGTQREILVANLVGQAWLKAALEQQSAPNILLLKNKNDQFAFSFGDAPESTSSETVDELHAKLKACYDDLCQGVKLVIQYTSGADTGIEEDEKILSIQSEDQALEEKADILNERLKTWKAASQPPGFIQRCWARISGGKAKALAKVQQFHESNLKDFFELDIALPLAEQIVNALRAIKVSRTKLHNELMWVTDALTQKKSGRQQLAGWLETHWEEVPLLETVDTNALCKDICEKMYHTLVTHLTAYWHARGETVTYQAVDADVPYISKQASIDDLIVLNGEALSCVAMMPWLTKAKRLMVLGDMANQIWVPIVPRQLDDLEIQHFKLAEGADALEELQFKGMTALSSVFELVQDKSHFKRMAAHGLLTQNDLRLSFLPQHCEGILTYANQYVYTQTLQSGQQTPEESHLAYYHVRTQIEVHLRDWLNQADCNIAETAILTIFPQQAAQLKESLKDFSIDIKSMNEISGFNQSTILFVPGLTVSDKKPYIFDQGEQLLNRAILSATKQFIVFGDLGIFDPKMHSPSGNLAKLLFKQSPMPFFFENDFDIVGVNAHQDHLSNALKANDALTIVSEGLDVKALQKWKLDEKLAQLREQQVRITFYIGTVGIMGLGAQAKSFKQQLQKWADLGISVYLVRNLHTNAIWWDEGHFIEGQFPWLSGLGKLSVHPFRSVKGDDKRKTSFQSYLGQHNLRAFNVVAQSAKG